MNAIQYKFPQDSWQTILLLAFFLYVDQASVGTLGSRIRNAVGGARTLDILRKLTVSVHIAEALAMLVVNIKRGSSPLVGLKWVVTTFVVGFPSWISFGALTAAVNNGIW
ncbi:uncharacterized protein MJAP1_001972 [Malassezia japonica]|uniref:Uncharacterized protein n=1 Tax=Malassezia japonica TaxID=223818 RepID=A0AAF0F2T1_9BASI|nr:uncharacterized protein MJAP1_001972 [Malassezia japonica]WFD39004.1 hypothetical protein MJAP1_001972 [Malassezia japonica]